MDTNENFSLSQGSALAIAGTLVNATGAVITTYDGTEALATTVWPGGMRPLAFTPVTTWTTPAEGTIAIAVAAADTAALAPGRYQLLTRVTPSGQDPVDAYGCTIDVLPFAGSEAAPTAYTTYDDLLKYGRSWLKQLTTDDDQAGFAEQQGRARSWIEDLRMPTSGSPRWRWSSAARRWGRGSAGPGPPGSSRSSTPTP